MEPPGKREDLVAAATRLFETVGYSNTSVREIVRESRTSRCTFYRYFATKDELVLAVALPRAGRVVDAVLRAAQEETDPLERIWVALKATLYATANDRVLRALLADQAARHTMQNVMYGTIDRIESAFVALVQEGLGPLAPMLGDLRAAISTYRLTVFAWFSEEAHRQGGMSLDEFARSLELMLRYTSRGVFHWAEVEQQDATALAAERNRLAAKAGSAA